VGHGQLANVIHEDGEFEQSYGPASCRSQWLCESLPWLIRHSCVRGREEQIKWFCLLKLMVWLCTVGFAIVYSKIVH